MTTLSFTDLPTRLTLCGILLLLAAPLRLLAEATPAALAAFDTYTAAVDSRLAAQHRSASSILAPEALTPANLARLRHGDFLLEDLTPAAPSAPGALLHHWRGTAFAPGAHAADFDRLLRDFAAYPRTYAPQVLETHILSQLPDRAQVRLRVRQKHVLTVVLDTTYDIAFPQPGVSLSRSFAIHEIDAPGTPRQRSLGPAEDHGFLWRMNTCWSYEKRDGGLYLQIESVSLSRSIPRGLAWAVQPFIQSIPRESLEFTLGSTLTALHR